MGASGDKLLVYFEDETHLVRRIGAAVVSCWTDLPEEVRRRIAEKAALVVDEQDADDIQGQIARFIAEHERGT